MPYAIKLSEEAARVRDGLPKERRTLLDHGLGVLIEDPRPKTSVPISGDDSTRSLALTPDIGIEYLINDGLLLVLVIRLVDLAQALVEE